MHGQLNAGGLADGFIEHIREKGVDLWLENGLLRYRGPKNALTPVDLERLRQDRERIVAALSGTINHERAQPILGVHQLSNRFPLAFSQLQHWNLYQLGDRPAFRHLALVKRLCGQLNVDALIRSVVAIVERHGALRTRIVAHNGIPMQETAESWRCSLEVDDLVGVPENCRECEVDRRIEQLVLEPIDVGTGPLFEIQLLKIKDHEHVLIVVMEHVIADMWSLNIFFQELFAAYEQAIKGREVCLPKVAVQFAEYAMWLRARERSWSETHGRYWNEHLSGCGRLRFPADAHLQSDTEPGWGCVPVHISTDLAAELRGWCRAQRTTLVMSVFTAYAALVLRWCGVSEAVIQFQTNGRTSQRLERTIGYFACPLSIRISLLGKDRFVDLLSTIIEAYCTAHEHADSSYLEALVPRPEFTRNTAFNWVSEAANVPLYGLGVLEKSITCSDIPIDNPLLRSLERDTEPFVLFGGDAMNVLVRGQRTVDELAVVGRSESMAISESAIQGGIYFPRNRFSTITMERFGGNLLRFIGALVSEPDGRVIDVPLR